MNSPAYSEIEENTFVYKNYILCTENVSIAYKTKEGDFVVHEKIKNTEKISEYLTDDYETYINNIYILKKKESNFEASVYFEFAFTLKKVNLSVEGRILLLEERFGIDSSDVVKKYGVHDTGLKQFEAVTRAIEDGCIEYLEFAKRKLYRIELPNYENCKRESFIPIIIVLENRNTLSLSYKTNIYGRTHYLVEKALESKNAQILAFLHETMKIELFPEDICKAFLHGDVESYKYLVDQGFSIKKERCCDCLSIHGHLDMIKYLYVKGYTITFGEMLYACMYNNVKIVQYYHNNIEDIRKHKPLDPTRASDESLGGAIKHSKVSPACLEYLKTL